MERLQELFSLYYNKTATEEQKAELMKIINEASENELSGIMKTSAEKLDNFDFSLSEKKSEEILAQILGSRPQAVIPIEKARNLTWIKVAVAASIILVMGVGGYFLLSGKPHDRIAIAKKTSPINSEPFTHRENGTMITLPGGKKVFADSLSSGTLAIQDNVVLVKQANGDLKYSLKDNSVKSANILNTLSNPRGSKVVKITLTDGTRVWLNVGSSLTYPIVFAGKERKVEINGEAYFEVAPKASMPFKIDINRDIAQHQSQIEVIGTHFSVNAFNDEPVIKTSLLEGKIKLTHGSQSIEMKPGQQVQILEAEKMSLIKYADMNEAIAWKEGVFQFKSTDLKAVMRQVSRWYNVEVEFEGYTPKKITGKIPTSMTAENVFKILEELTGGVRFNLDENKVIVKPKNM